jgi:hypothetical protein
MGERGDRVRGALPRVFRTIRRHPRLLLEAVAFGSVFWLLVRGVCALAGWDMPEGATGGIGAGTGVFLASRANALADADEGGG